MRVGGNQVPRWGALQIPIRKGVIAEMPMYIVLGSFTQEGIQKIKDSPKRLADAQKVAKSLGGEIKDFYYTMGRYDFVAVCEQPNNEAMTKALLIIAGAGAIRTETLIAIPAARAAELFKELP